MKNLFLLGLLTLSISACSGGCGATDPGPMGSTNFEIVDNPHTDNPAFESFSKYVEVFSLRIYAEDNFSDTDILHVAHMLAELIDNDEDGSPDDAVLLAQLQEAKFVMPMFADEDSAAMRAFEQNYEGDGVSAVLFAFDVDPQNPGRWGYDATVEELLHTIHHRGHVELYPEAFGLSPGGSRLTEAMDIARGGQFMTVPDTYPEAAWYHYTDKTCDYECMAIEYIYWAQVTNMGMLDTPETCMGIADEWEPCSRALLEEMDPLIFSLVNDPAFKLPLNAPDGAYGPATP